MTVAKVALVIMALLLLIAVMRAGDFSWRATFAVVITIFAIAAALTSASLL